MLKLHPKYLAVAYLIPKDPQSDYELLLSYIPPPPRKLSRCPAEFKDAKCVYRSWDSSSYSYTALPPYGLVDPEEERKDPNPGVCLLGYQYYISQTAWVPVGKAIRGKETLERWLWSLLLSRPLEKNVLIVH
jgi:hypothetical protein